MTIRRILKAWLPLAFLSTALVFLVYLVTQQVLRSNANDPQIQMAEDAAAVLATGATHTDLIPPGQVDIAASLSPFLVIYDFGGQPVAGNGSLHGALPVLPAGIFSYVDQQGEDRVTWQPEPGVRIAAVIVGFHDQSEGYVLAGRSLREVEKRVDQLSHLAVFAWVILLATSFLLVVVLEVILPDDRTIR